MSMVIMQLDRKAVKKNLEFSVIFLLLGVCHCVACQPGPGWEAGPAVACWAVSLPLSLSLFLNGEEGVRALFTSQREREREKKVRAYSKHSSFSQHTS